MYSVSFVLVVTFEWMQKGNVLGWYLGYLSNVFCFFVCKVSSGIGTICLMSIDSSL